ERAGARSHARRRLRKGGRIGSVIGHVALDLLNDLMDVAVENGHGAEPSQRGERGRGILRAPAPLRVDGTHRHVGEDHDGSAGAALAQVRVQPLQLLGPEPAESRRGQLHHVDQPDEMYAVRIEAVPAAAVVAASKALEEELAAIPDGVVLAGHVKDIPLDALHDLAGGGELPGGRKMTDVSGVDHEVRLQRRQPADRLEQGVLRGRMRAGLEADVRVADLPEAETADLPGLRPTSQMQRPWHAAGEGPQDARTAP